MTSTRLFIVLVLGALAYAFYSGKAPIPFPFGAPPAVHDHIPLIRDLAQKILVPLESKGAPSTESAEKAVADLSTEVNAHPGAADYSRSRRALALLSAALQERSACIEKALEKSPEGPFDKTPGIVWHDAWHREKVIDMEALQRRLRSSYWAGVYLAQWRDRCAYYRTAVDGALKQT